MIGSESLAVCEYQLMRKSDNHIRSNGVSHTELMLFISNILVNVQRRGCTSLAYFFSLVDNKFYRITRNIPDLNALLRITNKTFEQLNFNHLALFTHVRLVNFTVTAPFLIRCGLKSI